MTVNPLAAGGTKGVTRPLLTNRRFRPRISTSAGAVIATTAPESKAICADPAMSLSGPSGSDSAAVADDAALRAERVATVVRIPGLVAFWDFVARDGRHLAQGHRSPPAGDIGNP